MVSLSKVIAHTIGSEKYSSSSGRVIIRDFTGSLSGQGVEDCYGEPLQSFTESVEKRIDSYIKGAEILIENHFEDPIERKKYLDLLELHIQKIRKITAERKLVKGKLKREDFIAVTTSLIKFVEKSTEMSFDESFKSLLDAENISSWEQKKPTLVTVYEDNKDTIIQLAEPMTNLTENQAKEYMDIYKSPPPSTVAPPAWFSNLQKWHQDYLKNKLQDIYNDFLENNEYDPEQAVANLIEALNERLASPPSTIRYYPGLANYSKHTLIILDEYGNEKLRSSKERSSSSTVEAVRGHIEDSVESNRPLDIDRRRLTEQNLLQLLSPSKIKTKIDEFERDWDIEIGSDEFELPVVYTSNLSPLPVDSYIETIRTTDEYKKRAGGSSHYDNNTVMVDEKSEAFAEVLAICQATLESSHELEDFPNVTIAGVSTNYSINNERRIADPPGNIQLQQKKLIATTVKTLGYIAKKKDIGGLLPSGQLTLSVLNETREGATSSINMNSAQQLRYNLTLDAVNNYQRMIRDNLTESQGGWAVPNRKFHGTNLAVILSRVDSKIKRWGKLFIKMRDKPNNNLFLSSYEQIIAEQMGGIGFGHCKSGKDRKGLEIVHTDAMLIYYKEHGKFPKDHKDKEFVKIFVNHIRANHQQLMAEYNAPGCCGLQNLIDILPASIAVVLEKDMEKNQKNSKLNKPKIKDIRECLLDKKYIKKYGNLTGDGAFDNVRYSIQKERNRQKQSSRLSQLHRQTNSSTIEDVRLSPESRVVDIVSLSSAFEEIVRDNSVAYAIKEPTYEIKDDYSECKYKLANGTECELKIDSKGVEMEKFDVVSAKIAISMLIKTYGSDVELSFDGMSVNEVAQCEQIRQEIVSTNSPSLETAVDETQESVHSDTKRFQ